MLYKFHHNVRQIWVQFQHLPLLYICLSIYLSVYLSQSSSTFQPTVNIQYWSWQSHKNCLLVSISSQMRQIRWHGQIHRPSLLVIIHSHLVLVVRLFATPWTAARQASLSFTIAWSLVKLMSIESVMPPNHLILCRPLQLLPKIFPSSRVFSNEFVLQIKWSKYWGFTFNISPSSKNSGLISITVKLH